MPAIARMLVKRGAGLAPLLLFGIWLLSVLVAGLDMMIVWVGQLRGGGQPGDIYVALSQRLMLLAFAGALPPLIAWAIWRIIARLSRTRSNPPVNSGATP